MYSDIVILDSLCVLVESPSEAIGVLRGKLDSSSRELFDAICKGEDGFAVIGKQVSEPFNDEDLTSELAKWYANHQKKKAKTE